jgi:hypothetical protein
MVLLKPQALLILKTRIIHHSDKHRHGELFLLLEMLHFKKMKIQYLYARVCVCVRVSKTFYPYNCD